MRYELLVARRHLFSGRKNSGLSLITCVAVGGVTLGVAALIIMLSVTNGFTGEIQNRLIGMCADLSIHGSGETLSDYRAVMEELKGIPDVVQISPVIESKLVIVSKHNLKKIVGIGLWGVDPRSIFEVSNLAQYLKGQSELRLGALENKRGPGIVLGIYLARELQVGPGDEVLLITTAKAGMEDIYSETPLKLQSFVVTDIFESGLYQYDASLALVSLADAQQILTLGQSVTALYIHTADPSQAMSIRKAVEEVVGDHYRVQDWTQLYPELFRWMKLEKLVITIAISLIIVVASFGIMSNLTMSILIKTHEIGILRAMGATSSSIRHIFVLQGLAIGTTGTVLGCSLGTAVCFLQYKFKLITIPGDIYFINSLPVDMQLMDFLLVIGITLGICLLASIYPARKAVALLPVDAIRYVM